MLIKHLKNKWNYLALLFIVAVIFFITCQPHTYLSGWDNLQTDLNPWLAVKRAFLAVWQEYQSFGLVSGMAHAADLPRAVFLWLTSVILPANLIRYFHVFLMLFIGGSGLIKLLDEKKPTSFLAGLFYMFNIGTIQVFFLPYEAFIVFFAFLPWEMWIFKKIIKNSIQVIKIPKKDLILFVVINFLAIPHSYVQTIFTVYLVVLLCLTIGYYWEKKSIIILKRSLLLFLIIGIINSFWILPQIYFLRNNASVVHEAKINEVATEDTYYQNKEKGTLGNFIKMEGFYLELEDTNKKPFFIIWKNHFKQPITQILVYGFVLIVILGIISKSELKKSFLLLLGIAAVGLLNNMPPFSWVDILLRNNYLYSQIFRSPFTKFIVPYSLTVSYFFSQGLVFIYQKISKLLTTLNFILIFFIAIVLYSLPSFQGQFISNNMKIQIPQDYFELISYFKTVDKNKRIALLPDYTFWGWYVHRWGYNGSGFLWYGIEQPIVSRTFDVWSNKSESYFWEIKNALEAEDTNKMSQILNKYRINYIILDQSLLPIEGDMKTLQYDRLKQLLNNNGQISLVKQWPIISLYRVNNNNTIDNFVNIEESLPNIGPKIKITNDDTAYFQYGDYVTDSNKVYDSYYPFLDLTSQSKTARNNWQIEETEKEFILIKDLKIDPLDYQLVDQKYEINDFVKIQFRQKQIFISFPKEIILDFLLWETNVGDCGPKTGRIENEYRQNNLIVKSSQGALACFSYSATIEQTNGYLVKIENENIKGRRLQFYVQDLTKRQTVIENRLANNKEMYIFGPKYQYGIGYSFNFQNNSYINITSENILKKVAVYRFPFEQIKNIRLVRKDSNIKKAGNIINIQAKKINYFTYEVNINEGTPENEDLILYQSFDKGWKAYKIKCQSSKFKCQIQKTLPFIFGKELKNHVLVNNWANGWRLRSESFGDPKGNTNIVIVFLPQYLEYIGFVLLVIGFLGIYFYRR